MTSEVSCAPWQDLLLGSATTSSATYDECSPDTVVISTNAVTASGATSDNQEIVYQELCGNGQLTVKVSGLTGGYAGLFVRESSAAGARKGAIMTQLGASVQRQIRSITNSFQTAANITASGHQWLRITRTSTHVYSYWSTNGTSWNLAFFTPLAMTDCVVIGMAAYSTSSGTTINATFTNISVTQSDAIPATEVAFADSTLEAQGGDTVQICVNLQNPCYCSPVTVDVALTTDSLPHLIGFEPQTLTFEEGDTVQCFTVVLAEADTSGTYTFELTNLEGGNESEIGGIGELVLEVEGNEAEEEPGLCGIFIKDSTQISEGDKLFYDRFGNTYTDKEILKSSTLTEECGCGEFSNTDIPGVEESYFKLTFKDCEYETGGGFNEAGATGVARRKVACKVFAYLSQLITPKLPSCEGAESAKVNVRFAHINSQAVLQYVGTDVLAGASPYFDNNSVAPEGGILDCLPWRVINNGYYTAFDQIASSDVFHGEMAVDFNKTFYLDDGLPVPGNAYDLYSVLLHEALHFLGFASLIQPITGIPNLSADAISYGRYDTFLKLAGGDNVVAKDIINPYQWNLNIPAGDLHKSCHPTDNIDMVFPPLTGADIPVYTGSASDGAFLDGRAFSHLHPNCNGTTPNYLMKPEFDLGMRLEPGEAELKILCALGYNITGIEDCACVASGNHDFTEGCDGEPFEMEICEEAGFLDIDLADLLANDQPGVEVSYLTSTTPDANSIEDIGGGMIRFIPCAPGIHQLKYIPTKDGCADGSTVLITIKVTRCIDDCTFFSTDDPVNASYNNPCNLVCNPEVHINTSGSTVSDIESIEQNRDGICYDLPGWFAATGTPDYLALPTVNSNSGSIQLQSRSTGESVFTPVDAGSGTYFCSFYATCATGNTSSGSISINAKLVDDNIISQFSRHTGSPGGVGEINESLGESLFLSTLTVPFTQTASFAVANRRRVTCVEIPEGETYDALWFYPSGGSTSFTVRSYVDQVELIPDNFGLGEDLTIGLGCEIDLGEPFCMLSDVTIHYEWFEEVDNALVSIMAYNVLNGVATADDPEDPDNDDFDFDTHILTVAPNQTTTYVLQRSLITPNDLPAGFELCTTEDEVVVNVEEEEPEFVLVSEECGLVTFSITGLLPGHTWSIDYGNGNGTSLIRNYTLTPDTYTATLTVTNDCGTIEIPLEVAIEGCPELDCCPNTSSMLLVNTSISDAIAAGLPPGGTSSDICIEGFLMVDEDYTFSGNLFLGPDARIVVTSEATLELDGAHLQGCDFLWRGIEVKQPHVSGAPSLISHNETRIEDAKRGVDAANMVLLDIKETTFDRNFIGLYLDNVPISGFHGNTFDCTDVLKPSFSPAPNIGEYAYAGIQSQSAPLHIGVAGATVNTFQNLRNGIINLRRTLTVENSVFHNIEKATGEPYDITGYAIHHQGTHVASLDQRGLGYGTNATLTFDNCYTAIWASECNVRARFNRMADVHTGIQAQYCKNDDINIDHNRIACYGIGISLLQNDPANSILVWENHLYVNENSPTNAAGVGIFVQESGSQQFNAIIQQNPVYLYRIDKGIFLNTTKGYTVRDNDIFLESATVDHAMGIVMLNSALGRVSCNDVVGSGKGDGLVSTMTSATLYSCNTVENLNIGVSFDEASGSINLRTTEFLPPLSKGLLYKTNIAMMPAQIHRGNRWNTGTYGTAAVHEGSGTQDYFLDQRFEIHTTSAPYYPPSISLTGAAPSDWFVPTANSPFSICNPTVECPVFGFTPDKDEVKSRDEQLAGDEFAGEWPGGLHWAAQWQLYEMLERSPGIRDTSTIMDSYYTGKGTGALGRLHALQKDIDTLFQLLPEQQDTLQQYIEQTETLMEALALADSIAVHAPLSATPGLPQQLLAQCDSLLSLSEALVDEIFDARAAIIDTLFAQNAAITDTAIYIVNEKVVNEIYLSTLKQDSLALDTLQTDTLYAIATQCPETGGPAVYRARSLYALIAMVDFDTINCRSVASLQSPPQQALAQLPDKQANFHVFPNPNQGRFTVAYELEQDGMLVLTDILGRQAATASLLADTRRKEVSASELKAGLYYLHILSGNGELLYSNRIIIIH